jgi:phage-related protein
MAMLEFPQEISYGSKVEVTNEVLRANFGDGYVQRSDHTMNCQVELYYVEFRNKTEAQTVDIKTFLEIHGGWAPFKWTPPDPWDDEGAFICENWKVSFNEHTSYSIVAIFERLLDTVPD